MENCVLFLILEDVEKILALSLRQKLNFDKLSLESGKLHNPSRGNLS